MRATAIFCLCAGAFALAACPGPTPEKDDSGSAAPEANQVATLDNVIQTGNATTAAKNKCCTGVQITDQCIDMPANGCPADKPLIVSEP